jgi:hypothetical protein
MDRFDNMRVFISPCPMKHSSSPCLYPYGRAWHRDRWSKHEYRSSVSGHGSPLRHCARRLGLDALHRTPDLDQRAIDRGVIARQKFLHPGCASSLAKNLAAMSRSSCRSRFFENTEWSQAASSTPIPTNQRSSNSYPAAPSEAAPSGSNKTPATASPAAASPAGSTAAQSANRTRQTRAPAPTAPRSQSSGSLAAPFGNSIVLPDGG